MYTIEARPLSECWIKKLHWICEDHAILTSSPHPKHCVSDPVCSTESRDAPFMSIQLIRTFNSVRPESRMTSKRSGGTYYEIRTSLEVLAVTLHISMKDTIWSHLSAVHAHRQQTLPGSLSIHSESRRSPQLYVRIGDRTLIDSNRETGSPSKFLLLRNLGSLSLDKLTVAVNK